MGTLWPLFLASVSTTRPFLYFRNVGCSWTTDLFGGIFVSILGLAPSVTLAQHADEHIALFNFAQAHEKSSSALRLRFRDAPAKIDATKGDVSF